jgi:hypothetical protein
MISINTIIKQVTTVLEVVVERHMYVKSYCACKQEATESSNELNAVASITHPVHFKRVA